MVEAYDPTAYEADAYEVQQAPHVLGGGIPASLFFFLHGTDTPAMTEPAYDPEAFEDEAYEVGQAMAQPVLSGVTSLSLFFFLGGTGQAGSPVQPPAQGGPTTLFFLSG